MSIDARVQVPTTIHSVRPCKSGRSPTFFSVPLLRPVPIKNKVTVRPGVILFDPIFQGLAISLMAGELASTLLSRMAVPVLYYMSERRGV